MTLDQIKSAIEVAIEDQEALDAKWGQIAGELNAFKVNADEFLALQADAGQKVVQAAKEFLHKLG